MKQILPLLAPLALTACSAQDETVAQLRVHAETSTYLATVVSDPSVLYRLDIHCIDTCASSAPYSEDIDDGPMGLFITSNDNLLFSLWGSAVAFRVRVWEVKDKGVRSVAEISTRRVPLFTSDKDGRTVIETYESEGSTSPLYSVRWRYDGKTFVRGRPQKIADHMIEPLTSPLS
jgi:hypothetical protein